MMGLSIKRAAEVAAEAQVALRRRIRDRRDLAIASGIVVAGVPVQTDELSQARITGAALAASLDPTMTVRWKGANGRFVDLDAPVVSAIAQAERAHVQACFDHEADLLSMIDAGKDVDIKVGWPNGTSVDVGAKTL